MTVVAKLDEIPVGEGRAYDIDGMQIAVFHLRSGELRAIDAVCPHRGGPLADGLMDNDVVVCPMHGYTYELATGCERSTDMAVSTYPVSVGPAGEVSVVTT